MKVEAVFLAAGLGLLGSEPKAGVASDRPPAQAVVDGGGEADDGKQKTQELEDVHRQTVARDTMAIEVYGRGTTPGAGIIALLRNSAVRHELGLDSTQEQRIQEVLSRFQRQASRAHEEHVEWARRELARARGESSQSPNADPIPPAVSPGVWQQALAAILTPAQRRRLDQLALQTRGPLGLMREPHVVQRLGLRPDQQQRIGVVISRLEQRKARIEAELVELAVAANQAYREGVAGDPPKPNPSRSASPSQVSMGYTKEASEAKRKLSYRAAELDQEAIRAVGEILSQSQLQDYRRLVGEPFDFRNVAGLPKPNSGRESKMPTTQEKPSPQ